MPETGLDDFDPFGSAFLSPPFELGARVPITQVTAATSFSWSGTCSGGNCDLARSGSVSASATWNRVRTPHGTVSGEFPDPPPSAGEFYLYQRNCGQVVFKFPNIFPVGGTGSGSITITAGDEEECGNPCNESSDIFIGCSITEVFPYRGALQDRKFTISIPGVTMPGGICYGLAFVPDGGSETGIWLPALVGVWSWEFSAPMVCPFFAPDATGTVSGVSTLTIS